MYPGRSSPRSAAGVSIGSGAGRQCAGLRYCDNAYTEAVQVPHSLALPCLDTLPLEKGRKGRMLFTHSPFAGTVPRLHAYLKTNTLAAKRWSEAVGADCTDTRVLGTMALLYASQSATPSTVLFSSTNPDRIRENVAVLQDPPFAPAQVATFAALTRAEVFAASPQQADLSIRL